MCEGSGKNCMRRLSDEIGSSRLIDDDGEEKECLNNCKNQQYSFLLSQAVFPNKFTFHKLPQFCVIFEKLIRSCSGDRQYSLNEAQPRLCPLIEEALDNQYHCEDIQVCLI